MALRLLSATDVALGLAIREGHLRVVVRPSRFGGEFYSLEDAHGVITVADSHEEAMGLIKAVEEALN